MILKLLEIILIIWKPNLTEVFHVVLLGDFNFPGYDRVSGFPDANSYHYIELRDDVIHNAAFYLGLSQYKFTTQNKNLLLLVFANVSDVTV
jgi:hypothetical protein